VHHLDALSKVASLDLDLPLDLLRKTRRIVLRFLQHQRVAGMIRQHQRRHQKQQ